MNTHSLDLWIWFDGDKDRRRFSVPIPTEDGTVQTALEVGADVERAVLSEVIKQVRWARVFQENVQEVAGKALPPSQCSASVGFQLSFTKFLLIEIA
jgi:hypothetical protein